MENFHGCDRLVQVDQEVLTMRPRRVIFAFLLSLYELAALHLKKNDFYCKCLCLFSHDRELLVAIDRTLNATDYWREIVPLYLLSLKQ